MDKSHEIQSQGTCSQAHKCKRVAFKEKCFQLCESDCLFCTQNWLFLEQQWKQEQHIRKEEECPCAFCLFRKQALREEREDLERLFPSHSGRLWFKPGWKLKHQSQSQSWEDRESLGKLAVYQEQWKQSFGKLCLRWFLCRTGLRQDRSGSRRCSGYRKPRHVCSHAPIIFRTRPRPKLVTPEAEARVDLKRDQRKHQFRACQCASRNTVWLDEHESQLTYAVTWEEHSEQLEEVGPRRTGHLLARVRRQLGSCSTIRNHEASGRRHAASRQQRKEKALRGFLHWNLIETSNRGNCEELDEWMDG